MHNLDALAEQFGITPSELIQKIADGEIKLAPAHEPVPLPPPASGKALVDALDEITSGLDEEDLRDLDRVIEAHRRKV